MADPLYRMQMTPRDPFAESDRPRMGTGGAQGAAGTGIGAMTAPGTPGEGSGISEADLNALIQMLRQMGPPPAPQPGAAFEGVAGPQSYYTPKPQPQKPGPIMPPEPWQPPDWA